MPRYMHWRLNGTVAAAALTPMRGSLPGQACSIESFWHASIELEGKSPNPCYTCKGGIGEKEAVWGTNKAVAALRNASHPMKAIMGDSPVLEYFGAALAARSIRELESS